VSPHDSNGVPDSMDNSASSKLSALPTITRTSNHSTADYSNSNDAESNCSWVELDFDLEGAGAGGGKRKNTKPVSHVNIAQYLVDDQESSLAGSDKEDSSTTSNLSEDSSVENGKENNSADINKGDAKGDDRNRNPRHQNEQNDDDSDVSVTSFASASFANGVPFDDLLEESLMESNKDLAANMQNEKVPAPPLVDEIIEVGSVSGHKKPTSFRSGKTEESSGDVTKPSSEISRSSESKRMQRKISPKPKQSKKKAPGQKLKSPAVIQGRKRLQSPNSNNGEGTVDNETKENKKKLSPKPKQKSVDSSTRRRHPQPPLVDDDDTTGIAVDSEHKDTKKKAAPKAKPASTATSQRRQRLRSSDGEENVNGSVEEEGKEQQIPEGSIRSLEGTGDAKRKQERYRTKSKSSSSNNNTSSSKTHRRKTPSRRGSGEIGRNKKGETERNEKREVRKRYKKRNSASSAISDNEMEDDTERDYGTKSRSFHKEKKDKMRRKSNSSDGKKRKKKKQPTETKPTAAEEEMSPNAACGEDEGDEELTYSFHFQSDDENREEDEWLNTNNSTSSSLSYNSFAQFSIDVQEMNRSRHFGPDLDASQKSFSSNHTKDVSVVFMAGKSSSRHSMRRTISFDGDDDSRGDNDHTASRSTRSCPTGSDGLVIKPEKQLRRRLKKDGNQNRNDSNVDMKKKVRRTRSGGVERTKSLTLGDGVFKGVLNRGKRSVERTKSHSEALISRRREVQSRRKREKHSGSTHSRIKQVMRSKSAHMRSLSASPRKENQKGSISRFEERSDNCDGLPSDKVVLLNDINDEDNTQDPSATWRSPKRSPRVRQVHRTVSNPGPSPSFNIAEVYTPNALGKNAIDIDCSPMSFGNSPSLVEKKLRKSSPSRQRLLSADTESDNENYQSDNDYPSESPGSHHRRPHRGSLQRTPSSLLAAVRSLKHSSSNNVLSKVKRTFSVSGRGSNTFKSSTFEDIDVGISSMKGYVSRKERHRIKLESENRRGQVKNSLYACMTDDEDSVEISSESSFDGDNDDSMHNGNNDNDQRPMSSSIPKRVKSLEKTKMSQQSDDGSDHPSRPRRVNSLPLGLRR